MFKFSRILVAYVLAVPLALFLGYLACSPGKFTFSVVGILLFFMALPLFLKWHHVMMIVFWNSAFNIFFLPGAPDLWLLCAALSFGISFLNHIIFQKQFLRAPELTRPLLFLAAVVLVTAWIRGGIGIRALGGSTYGGKYYYMILISIAGYFALTSEQIPLVKGPKMGCLFFLSGTTFALSNLIYFLGPAFFFLYNFVPSSLAVSQAASSVGMSNIDRITGLGQACSGGLLFLLARYGIRGLFDMTRPWRFALLLITFGASFFAGFRSVVVMLLIIFAIQFYLEGLLHTHFFPIVIGLAVCGFVPIVFFSDKMPSAVQRSISYLPVKVDTEILENARDSTDWRLGMWAIVVKELPKYLIIGKGYVIDPNELALVMMANQLGVGDTTPYEGSIIAGDYHNGPLSVIMPFGIFGMLGFIWVLIGGYKVLARNHRYGEPRLRKVNTTIFAFYLTSCFCFFFIFGALSSQLYIFLGLCGISVSLNGGVRRRAAPKPRPVTVPRTLAMEPG